MSQSITFATKIPAELKEALDRVCQKLGLKKNFVVETALKDKLEDLIDTHDLQEAMQEASGFHSWKSVKKELNIK